MPVYKTLNHNFFVRWSPEMAYVLGFFAADGSMLKNRRGAHFIEFQITDRDILVFIQKALGSNHTISVRNRDSKYSTAYRLQLGSKLLFEGLVRHGFTQAKSRTLRMPSVPNKFLPDFIRGYFDGDGCVYFATLKFADRKKPRHVLQTIFTSGSRDFLLELRKVLHHHGLMGGSVRRKTRGFDLLFSHKDSIALYSFMYNTISAADFFLARKHLIFQKAIKTLYPDADVA